jgi:hypothetical protein
VTELTINTKSKLIADVKAEANRRIIAALPEWKQRNLIARGLQLVNNARAGTLSTEEEAEVAAIDSVWETTVVPIRAHSDYLEDEVNAGRAIDLETGWP